jgi:hypothetical protein
MATATALHHRPKPRRELLEVGMGIRMSSSMHAAITDFAALEERSISTIGRLAIRELLEEGNFAEVALDDAEPLIATAQFRIPRSLHAEFEHRAKAAQIESLSALLRAALREFLYRRGVAPEGRAA